MSGRDKVLRWGVRSQILVPVALLLLGLGSAGLWESWYSAQRAVQAALQAQAQRITTVFQVAHYPINRQVLVQVAGFAGMEFVFQNTRGDVFASIPETQVRALFAITQSTSIKTVVKDSLFPGQWTSVRLDRQEFYLQTRWIDRPTQSEAGQLWILAPVKPWQLLIRQGSGPALLAGTTAVLLSLLSVAWLMQRFAQRVQQLNQQTQRIAAGNYVYVPAPVPAWQDELSDLAVAINRMADQLQRLQQLALHNERLRLLEQLSNALAHQLRNGITGAKLALQLYGREIAPQPMPEALGVALQQLQQLEERLAGLLYPSDPNVRPATAVAIPDLVAEVIHLLTPKCQHTRIQLGQAVQPKQRPLSTQINALVWGHLEELRQLFYNVLDNAVDAAQFDGVVWVEYSQREQNLDVTVWDSGAGPEPTLADRLFEPLVTGKVGGLGLGLAIGQKIAADHHGTLRWQRCTGPTIAGITLHTAFIITLPLYCPTDANDHAKPAIKSKPQ